MADCLYSVISSCPKSHTEYSTVFTFITVKRSNFTYIPLCSTVIHWSLPLKNNTHRKTTTYLNYMTGALERLILKASNISTHAFTFFTDEHKQFPHCADVLLRNYSLTKQFLINKQFHMEVFLLTNCICSHLKRWWQVNSLNEIACRILAVLSNWPNCNSYLLCAIFIVCNNTKS